MVADEAAMARHILVVDDTENTRSILTFILQSKGFEVAIAMNGEEALEKFRARPPDLMVLDAMMPKMSGYEVCAAIKGDERFGRIPIVMLTAQAEQAGETVQRWKRDLRPDEVMAKPFKVQELVARIEQLLAAPRGSAGA
jgi:two-component system alkaline phosphatase synthesis response regulator PhoP